MVQEQVPTQIPQQQPAPILGSEQSEPQKSSSEPSWFLNAILGVGVIGIGVLASFFILTGGKQHPYSAVISPTPIAITESLVSEYANPFDVKTQYANPFAENTNPFDGFAQ